MTTSNTSFTVSLRSPGFGKVYEFCLREARGISNQTKSRRELKSMTEDTGRRPSKKGVDFDQHLEVEIKSDGKKTANPKNETEIKSGVQIIGGRKSPDGVEILDSHMRGQ